MLKEIEKRMDHEPPNDDVQRQLEKLPDIAKIKSKIGLSFLGVMLAGIALAILFVSSKDIKPPKVFLTFPSGESRQVAPLVWPVQSGASIESWALDTVKKVYTFDFLHAEEQLAEARPFFTAEGWNSFTAAMESSELMATVEKNLLTVAVTPLKPPIIESTAGGGGGEFAWRVIVPVMVSFTGDTPTQSKYMLMRVLVVRVPTTENPRGLGVQQLVSGIYSPTK